MFGIGGSKKRKKKTKYKANLDKTAMMRHRVPTPLVPLFDHLIVLAEGSHARGYKTRAGIELRKARDLADDYPEGIPTT
jgi:hypothetical protein